MVSCLLYTITTMNTLLHTSLGLGLPCPGGKASSLLLFEKCCSGLISEPFYSTGSCEPRLSPTFGQEMSGDGRDLKNIWGSFVLKLVLVPLCIWRGFVVRFWLFASFGNCWDVRSHIVSIIFYSFVFNSLWNILDTQQAPGTWLKTGLSVVPPFLCGAHLAGWVSRLRGGATPSCPLGGWREPWVDCMASDTHRPYCV